MTKNYYGSLCTEMYEILHKKAPQDELEFYLSYAEKGMSFSSHYAAADGSWYLFWKEAMIYAAWIYQQKCLQN